MGRGCRTFPDTRPGAARTRPRTRGHSRSRHRAGPGRCGMSRQMQIQTRPRPRRRRSLRLTRRPSASVSREPGSRTRIPDRWPSCYARHCAGRRGGERSATEIFKVTPEIAEYQQRFSRLISHRVPFGDAGRAFSSRSLPGSPALCPGHPGRHRLAATGRGRTGAHDRQPGRQRCRRRHAHLPRFPRVPAQGSIDNARGVARPLPDGRGSDAGPGGEPGRRVHGWLGGCWWSACWRAGFVGGGESNFRAPQGQRADTAPPHADPVPMRGSVNLNNSPP
jgi:hypothetical protein